MFRDQRFSLRMGFLIFSDGNTQAFGLPISLISLDIPYEEPVYNKDLITALPLFNGLGFQDAFLHRFVFTSSFLIVF